MSKLCVCICVVYFFGSVVLSGCGKGFEANVLSSTNPAFHRQSTSKLFVPETDKVVSDCHKSGAACIYFKNPVFQTEALVKPTDESGLSAAQTFSVQLTNVDKSGFLKNSSLDLKSIDGSRMPLSQVLTSKGLTEAPRNFLSAFYWLNRAEEYLQINFQNTLLANRNITIFVDDGFDGWIWSKKSMHLNTNKKSALSAEVMLALYGEALVGLESNGEIYRADGANHLGCNGDPIGCCKTNLGCSQAVLHGVGNYFVAMLFEDAPSIGEFYAQNLNGQQICSKDRNPLSFTSLNSTQAYNLCADQVGNTHALGLVYASIWVKLRSDFDAKTIDALFLKHLKLLKGTDTLQTAKTVISNLCLSDNQPQIAQAFQAEFTRRGL